MIYEEVLCGPIPIIHIVPRKKRKFDSVRCKDSRVECLGHLDDDNIMQHGLDLWEELDKADGDLLPLLQSCRRM